MLIMMALPGPAAHPGNTKRVMRHARTESDAGGMHLQSRMKQFLTPQSYQQTSYYLLCCGLEHAYACLDVERCQYASCPGIHATPQINPATPISQVSNRDITKRSHIRMVHPWLTQYMQHS